MICDAIAGYFERRAEFRARWNAGTHPQDPALVKLFARNTSSSGVEVDRETALGYPPVWRGVNLISGDVGKLPAHIYQRTGDARRRATEHPSYRKLRRKPNSMMTANVFKQTLTAHALLEGNGYGYIYRKGDRSVDEIVPLLPDRTFPVRETGVLWYVTRVAGEDRKLPAEDVLHIKGLSFNGLVGYSVVDLAAEALGLGVAMQKHASTYFGNGACPSGILHHPATLKDEAVEMLRESWREMHTGLDNHHKLALFEEGATYTPLTHEPEKSQLVEARKLDLLLVSDILGVPPHKLGHDSRTSHASLEQENQSYLDDGLDIWLVRWEEECWDKLLAEEEKSRDTHYVEFLRDAILRTTAETASNIRINDVNNGLRLPDEARALMNLPPMPDGLGQKFRMPANIVIQGEEPPEEDPPGQPPDAPPPGEDDEEDDRSQLLGAARLAFITDATRACKRLGLHARRAAKTPGKFLDWLDGVAAEHGPTLEDILRPSLLVCRASAGADGPPDEQLQALVGDVFRCVRDGLLEAAESTPDRFGEAVEARMAQIEATEPERLADTLIQIRTTYHPSEVSGDERRNREANAV
jgi:HK97 family phage portal protein